MNDLLIDTSVLVDVLRELAPSSSFLGDARRTHRLVIHPVVEAELIAGARNRSELKLVSKLLDRFESVPIEPIDARNSIRLLRGHRLADGVSWEDCLLAATAMRRETAVATLNDKHFRAFVGLGVLRPY